MAHVAFDSLALSKRLQAETGMSVEDADGHAHAALFGWLTTRFQSLDAARDAMRALDTPTAHTVVARSYLPEGLGVVLEKLGGDRNV